MYKQQYSFRLKKDKHTIIKNEVDELVYDKIKSGEFIAITKKEYESMRRALKNFQARNK